MSRSLNRFQRGKTASPGGVFSPSRSSRGGSEAQSPGHPARLTAPWVLAVGILAFASGCAVGPQYKAPQTELPGRFRSAETYGTNTVDVLWWRSFQDSQLETLISESVTNNPDLRIATARLKQARALLNESRLDYYPTIRNEEFYNNGLSSLAARPNFPRSAREGELYHAGFDASWELDFFGHVRRSVQAARAQYESLEAQRREVWVSLVSEVARNYFELRGTQVQLEVAVRNAENQRETVRLATALREGGRGTELDVARAKTQLNSTLASIPLLESSIERSLHRMAVLVGEQPGSLPDSVKKGSPASFRASLPDIGNPSDLLRRRPDVRVAERDLAAATARVGIATADLFPRVTFNGNVALEGTTFARMGKAGGDTWGFGPRISWAALDLGRVRQRVRAAGAEAEAALANYEKVVLLALEETENALVDYGRQRARREALAASAESANQAVTLARQRYQDGVTDFLTVLDAERVLLQTQDSLAASETRTATALIAIYKALDGGWTLVSPGTGEPPSNSTNH